MDDVKINAYDRREGKSIIPSNPHGCDTKSDPSWSFAELTAQNLRISQFFN